MEPAQRRKTRVAWNETGHAHFLTYSCFQRLPLLTKDRTRGWVVAAMESARHDFKLSLWAYVIMPEHVHLLLHPLHEVYEMRTILAALKRSVAKNAKEHLNATFQTDWLRRLTVQYPSRHVFRFWQPGGGFDRNVFKERTVPSVIEYVHDNPDADWSKAQWIGSGQVPASGMGLLKRRCGWINPLCRFRRGLFVQFASFPTAHRAVAHQGRARFRRSRRPYEVETSSVFTAEPGISSAAEALTQPVLPSASSMFHHSPRFSSSMNSTPG